MPTSAVCAGNGGPSNERLTKKDEPRSHSSWNKKYLISFAGESEPRTFYFHFILDQDQFNSWVETVDNEFVNLSQAIIIQRVE